MKNLGSPEIQMGSSENHKKKKKIKQLCSNTSMSITWNSNKMQCIEISELAHLD